MKQTGTLPIGIEVDGKYCRDYTLAEERFKHKLAVYTDQTVGQKAVLDPAYHAAAIIAARLTVDGIDKVTPEMVLDLFPEDGNEIGHAGSEIAGRRAEFRKAPGNPGSEGDGSSADKNRLSPA